MNYALILNMFLITLKILLKLLPSSIVSRGPSMDSERSLSSAPLFLH